MDPSPDLSYTGVVQYKRYPFGVSYTGARASRFFYYPSALEKRLPLMPEKNPQELFQLSRLFCILAPMKNVKLLSLITVLLLVSVIAILFVSCEEEKDGHQEPERIQVDSSSTVYRIYVLDGCEYVCFGVNERRWGGHKGDCKNPIHPRKTP